MSGVRGTRAIKTSTKQIDKVDVLDGANSLKKLLEVVMRVYIDFHTESFVFAPTIMFKLIIV